MASVLSKVAPHTHADTTEGGPIVALGAVPLVDALPTASAVNRGQLYLLTGGAGVADRLVICRKDTVDDYTWTPVL